MIHVIPLEDKREHELSLACWCFPTVDGHTLIHHALDCREKYERQGVVVSSGWAVISEEDCP